MMRFSFFFSSLFITTVFFTSLSFSSTPSLPPARKLSPPPLPPSPSPLPPPLPSPSLSPLPSPSPSPSPLPPPLPSPSPLPPPLPSPTPSPTPPPPPSFPKPSIELTPPLATAKLPLPPPECTLHLITTHYSQPPFTAVYSPPKNCASPWSHAVLQFSGEITGNQSYLIGGIWLSGVEILRTSTPESSDINGTFWNVTKDITKYNSLLHKPNISISLMFENLVNGEFTGHCDFNSSILFYKDLEVIKLGSQNLGLGFGELRDEIGVYDEPADLVIPIVNKWNQEYWFRIERESEVGLSRITIPENARRVVLELYVSFHGDDELWFSNPPNDYIDMNNLSVRGRNGASRQVLVKIDGELVAYEVPFPVIYTGGINQFSWGSIVSIGAFNLPSYDTELTPFLGGLLDRKNHSVEIGVTNAGSFWLVDANLHVWLDQSSSKVEAGVIVRNPPEFEESREFEFEHLDGEFEFEVERKSEASGWVADSLGNFTTIVSRKLEFNNKINYQENGAEKIVEQTVKVKTEVKVVSETNSLVSSRSFKREYPLKFATTISGQDDTNSIKTNVKLGLTEISSNRNYKAKLMNTQNSKGSLVVKDGSILSGTAQTHQHLSYKSPSKCVFRTADAAGGKLVTDLTTACSSNSIEELSSGKN